MGKLKKDRKEHTVSLRLSDKDLNMLTILCDDLDSDQTAILTGALRVLAANPHLLDVEVLRDLEEKAPEFNRERDWFSEPRFIQSLIHKGRLVPSILLEKKGLIVSIQPGVQVEIDSDSGIATFHITEHNEVLLDYQDIVSAKIYNTADDTERDYEQQTEWSKDEFLWIECI